MKRPEYPSCRRLPEIGVFRCCGTETASACAKIAAIAIAIGFFCSSSRSADFVYDEPSRKVIPQLAQQQQQPRKAAPALNTGSTDPSPLNSTAPPVQPNGIMRLISSFRREKSPSIEAPATSFEFDESLTEQPSMPEPPASLPSDTSSTFPVVSTVEANLAEVASESQIYDQPRDPFPQSESPSDFPDVESSVAGQRYVSTDAAQRLPRGEIRDSHLQSVQIDLPAVTLQPWWNDEVQQPILAVEVPKLMIDLESLVWQSLANSPQIQSILTTPQIRQAEVSEASGIFDPTRFVESMFHDTSDPVGNLLTTGGAPRLNEHYLQNNLGVRGLNQYGGKTELYQDLGLRNNNSQFFVPAQQADSRMVLRYTQPLKRGAGTFYNRSSIAIAQIAANISTTDANLSMQKHVFDVSQAYWLLFYHRATLLQGQRALVRLRQISENIEARADIDGTRSQASRARAAVVGQQARIQRAFADQAKMAAQLRMLVNSPELVADAEAELLPVSIPLNDRIESDVSYELAVALEGRPEVIRIRDQIRASQVQIQVAANDLRSTLNLVTETYIRGLNGDYAFADSFADQFARGRPSYSAGLSYQRPNSNTAAKAIMRQRNLQMRQLLFDLDQQLLNVGAEIRSAAAELDATYAEFSSSVTATLATADELQYLVDRWESNPDLENSNPALLLDEILDAQSRLIQTENNWALAQSTYMIAIARARLAAGTMLTFENYAELAESSQAP